MCLEIEHNEEDSLPGVCTRGLGETMGVREGMPRMFDPSEYWRMYTDKSVGLRKKTRCPGGNCWEAKDRRGPRAADGQERYGCSPGSLCHEEEVRFIGPLICSVGHFPEASSCCSADSRGVTE